MSRLRRFVLRLSTFLRPERADRELTREVGSHLGLLEDEFQRRGMPPEEARLAARRAFGGVEEAKERSRDERSFLWLEDARRDVRHAARSLTRAPGFTAVAVVTLALGIGANSAVFSVVRAVLLEPLPYRDPDRLVRVVEHVPPTESFDGTPQRIASMDLSELIEFRRRTQTLSHVAAYRDSSMTLTGREEAIRLDGVEVSPATFPMLGAQALLGRVFESRDEAPGAEAVLILSYAAWQRYFRGDPGIVGHILTLDGTGYSVVGVMPGRFRFPNAHAQFWVPFVLTAPREGRTIRVAMMGRLTVGVSMQAAAAEVSAILHHIRGDPQVDAPAQDSDPPRFELVGVQDQLVAPLRPALLVLTVAVGVVLLIACVNVANLLLARAAARHREIAVRAALGAGRGRLVRQALTESVMLALVGGIAGTGLALGGVELLGTLGASLTRRDLGPGASIPRLDEIGIDASVFAFTMAVSVVTGLLVGLAPALRHSGPDQMDMLRDGAASAVCGFRPFRRHRLRGLLVVAEIGMAMMLFVGGGLLIHSFVRLSSLDPGYDPMNVLTFQVALPQDLYSSAPQLRTFDEDLVARLQALPEVESAAYAQALPLLTFRLRFSIRTTPGASELPPSRLSPPPRAVIVSRDYLTVMGVRVIAGRGFGEHDRAGQPRVMLINQALADGGFAGENPIGQTVYSVGHPWEIVGIVEDVRQSGLDVEPEPQFFADFRQWPGTLPVFDTLPSYYAVRTDGEPTLAVSSIRGIVGQLDPHGALYNVATMEQLISNSIFRPRLYAVLAGIFAGVAVAIAVIGIYGIMAYFVAQRTREIGIRMALGAQRSDVLGLVLRQSVVLTTVGFAFGLAGAAGVTRYLDAMLFGLTPFDPATFIAVSLMFGLVATLAAFVPARRATKVDPLIALRYE